MSCRGVQPRRQDRAHRELRQDGAALGRGDRPAHRPALRIKGAVSAVAFSPDGKTVLTGSRTTRRGSGTRPPAGHSVRPSAIRRWVNVSRSAPTARRSSPGAMTARCGSGMSRSYPTSRNAWPRGSRRSRHSSLIRATRSSFLTEQPLTRAENDSRAWADHRYRDHAGRWTPSSPGPTRPPAPGHGSSAGGGTRPWRPSTRPLPRVRSTPRSGPSAARFRIAQGRLDRAVEDAAQAVLLYWHDPKLVELARSDEAFRDEALSEILSPQSRGLSGWARMSGEAGDAAVPRSTTGPAQSASSPGRRRR